MVAAEPIAIVGSGCRFPGGASSPSALWTLLKDPIDLASKVPADRFNIDAFYHPDSKHHGTTNIQEAYFLSEDVRRFDAPFFNISAVEAEAIDPQQRILLETVYEAIERAGIRPASLQGSSTGAFCGVMYDDYNQILLRDTEQPVTYAATGLARSNLSNRLSYFFDWHGPSITIDTACSSSLVAVHMAVQSLRDGSCRVAVASGANLILAPAFFIFASTLNMLSPTGRSRMWDASADGYARGEGVAAVVLKRLSDAIADGDHIESVIRETGINQDGRTMGITMPSGPAQAQLIRSTYEKAGLRPDRFEDRCQYFEAHGTGTQAGDPQEASAIAEAFFHGTDAKVNGNSEEKLLVGSVKTVIGHTEGTAGIAGLLKASMCIQHGAIAPNLHFNSLSPKVEPFYHNLRIPTAFQLWPELPHGVPRRASVNSFGFGGTNAHAILESYDSAKSNITSGDVVETPTADVPLPFVFSASSDRTLTTLLQSWSQFLASDHQIDYTQLAMALFSQRDGFKHKFVMRASSADDLRGKIVAELERRQDKNSPSSSIVRRHNSGPKRILAVFTGQGAQWPRMGLDLLLASARVRRWIEELQDSLEQLPPQYRPLYVLMDELSAPPDCSRLSEAAISQPLCTALQIVQVNLLREVGVGISAVVGHSSGEIAAAYAAGCISAADAIRIAHLRGRVAKLAGAGSRPGAMVATGLEIAAARALCEQAQFRGRVAIAAYNSPQSVTLSGDADAVEEVADFLKSQERFARVLKVDTAYHSHHMKPCSGAYLAGLQCAGVQAQVCQSVKWISTLKPGHTITSSDLESLSDSYWVDNMLKPVHFTQSVAAAVEAIAPDMFLELGPHAALKGPLTQTLSDLLPHDSGASIPYIGLLNRGESGLDCFAAALGLLWTVAGPGSCSLASYARLLGNRVESTKPNMKSIPTYPFDHTQSYWTESRASKAFAYRPQVPNQLLGKQTTDTADGEWSWRNYLRLEEMPWLSGHKIESQIIFPATGYVAMAVEAAAIIADNRPLRLVQLCNVQIENATTLSENPSSSDKTETLFKVQNFQSDVSGTRATATFSCHASFAGEFRRCAHGTLDITFGDQEKCLLPSRNTSPQGLSQVNIDEFYSYLRQFGYEYEGLFRGITECSRKMDLASGIMMNALRMDTGGSLIMHPAMMDTLLQGFLAAIGACHDGRLYKLYVPTGISRISINPLFGGLTGMADDKVAFDARVIDNSPGSMQGDAAVFDLAGNCAIQIDGAKFSPLTASTAADDRLMFSEPLWGPLDPDAALLNVEPSSQAGRYAELQGQLVVLYMKQILDKLSEDRSVLLSPRGEKVVRWFNSVISLVRAGTHSVYASNWLDATIDDVTAKLDATTPIVEAIRIIGEKMSSFLCGTTTMSEIFRQEGDLLHRIYGEFAGRGIIQQMASVANHITFRYPHMRILEIGAGPGSTTGSILDHIGQSYHSYTYTDISPDYFDGAKEFFKDYSDRFIYRTLDTETSMAEQGFKELSYDLVVAANLLHSSASLQETLARVRSLLKPGGYLLLTTCTNPSVLSASFIYCGFKTWGAEDAYRCEWAPTVTVDGWDKSLKAAGFSGVDSITPGHGSGLRPFSVLVSQAVNTHVMCLRDPIMYGSQAKSNHGHLYIIGGASPSTMKLAKELKTSLSPFFDTIVAASTLDSRNLKQPAPMSSALILDVDGPLLKNITEPKFEGLKRLIDTCHNVLWVSCGSEMSDPYIGMNNGLLRSVGFENPHSRYQHFNIADLDSVEPRVIAEQLLRMDFVTSDNDYTLSNLVWSTEEELRLEGGRLWISRIKNVDVMNRRYMSSRRVIYSEVDVQDSSVSIADSGELSLTNDSTAPGVAAGIRIRVRYSTSAPIRFENAGMLYLVVGMVEATGVHVLALSSSRQSVVSVPPNWCWNVPGSIDAASEATYLHSVELSLLAETLLRQAAPNDTILIYNADDAVQLAISTMAPARSVKPIFVTNSPRKRNSSSDSIMFIHGQASSHTLRHLLRPILSSTNAFLNVKPSMGGADGELGERLESLLPPSIRQETLHSLRNIPARLSDCICPTAASLEVARPQALEVLMSQSVPTLVDIQQVGESGGLLNIIDWTKKEKVPVRVGPASSMISLSPMKTYLLVGMTGTLGRSVAQWMISRGARNIVLTSRSPKVEQWWNDEMENAGAKVTTMAMDVTDKASIIKANNAILKQHPKIGGIVNGATVIRDAWLSKTSIRDWEDILKPKVQGSTLLSELYADKDLEFFILMGSISGHIGNRSQSAYAAANSYMLSIVRQRRHKGLVGSIISPGQILGVGYVASADAKLTELLNSTLGCYNMSEQDLHELFAEGILAGRPEAGRSPDIIAGLRKSSPMAQPDIGWYQTTKAWHFIDSHGEAPNSQSLGAVAQIPLREQVASASTAAESASLIEAAFLAKVASKLVLSAAVVSREASLVELGVDSLVAMELRSWLAKEAGLHISTLRMLGDHSIAQLLSESLE